MTRAEFFEVITTWYDLKDFCWEHDCDICDDVYDGCSINEIINEGLVDRARACNDWTDLRSYLDNIPDICEDDHYLRDDYYDEWNYLDYDDFIDYREDVAAWMDRNGEWDDENEAEEIEEAPTEEEEDDLDCEGILIDDFITLAGGLVAVPVPEPKVKEEENHSEPKTNFDEDDEMYEFDPYEVLMSMVP